MKHRVLFIAHSPHRGGAEYCLDTLLGHIDRERFEPVVVFPDEGPMADEARAHGCRVLISPMCYWLNFRKSWWYWKNLIVRSLSNVMRLRRIIREEQVDVVYTNSAAVFESALAARLAGVPHLWHVHEVLRVGNRMHQLLPMRLLKWVIARWSDAVIFESRSSREVFEQSTPVELGHVIYNSARLTGPSDEASREADRRRLGLGPGDRVLGFVGQFNDRKNPLHLIRALHATRDVDRLKCLFVGAGPLHAAMQELIDEFELSDCCQVLPFQQDVGPVLNAIDVLALPSREESFGLVLVEAAMYRRPSIACRSQGPDEIVVDGETGFLVEQDDVAQLADRIRGIFRGDAVAHMGDAAHHRARERFDPRENARRIEEVIADVVASKTNDLRSASADADAILERATDVAHSST